MLIVGTILQLLLLQLKQSLPKRESERSKHHLSQRHSLLQAIDTRLSILTMTYKRWIDDGLVCFIPGKVRTSTVIFL